MASSDYVTIRDDAGLKSLSLNERQFLRSCALRGVRDDDNNDDDDCGRHVGGHDDAQRQDQNDRKILRLDGRRGNDIRKVRIQLQRWDNGSECTVQWGSGTRVTVTSHGELVPPTLDRPAEGVVNFTVDLSPMAASVFKLAPAVSTNAGAGGGGGGGGRGSNHSDQSQRLLSNRILRCVERIVLTGGALDTEALVLQAGKWVWRLTVSITVLDAGGNLLDACVLAALASLRHYRKPQVDYASVAAESETSGSGDDDAAAGLPTMVPSTIKEATPLPLHHTPLSISFGLIPTEDTHGGSTTSATSSSSATVVALIDPTDREELVQTGTLTIAMNVHSEVCLLDYGGGCELTPNKLRACWKVAEMAIKDLCRLLETTLTQADEQAQKGRLERLQLQRRQQQQKSGGGGSADFIALSLPPLPASVRNQTPYLQEMEDIDNLQVVDSAMADAIDSSHIQQAQTEAEEAYRRQALDYSVNHLASSVRDDDDVRRGGAGGRGGTSSSSSMSKQQASSLLAAMLQSVGHEGSATTTPAPASEPIVVSVSAKVQTVAMDVEVGRDDTKSETGERGTVYTSNGVERSTAPKKSKPVPMSLDDDDEEEPTTVMLQSEFGNAPDGSTVKAANDATTTDPDNATAPVAEEPVEIDDFAMAIKSKGNSKKKKSKKK